MQNYSAKNIDEYIANSTIEARPILEEIQGIIKSTISDVEEKISWGVPFYRYHGDLAGFAVYKNHVSFGISRVLQSEERKMLEEKGYKTGNKTIQIRFDQKVPTAAIKQIVKEQVKMNQAKNK
ncbi:MAG TPA: DUF1801 domain-containing protein [Patescibacteria group bacterium]|nr:DUF1801 domain-containing protein [Patescibacteria group bacterium]